MLIARKPYPSDVSDDESALVAAYRTLLPEESGQRTHAPREVFKRPAAYRENRRAVALDGQ